MSLPDRLHWRPGVAFAPIRPSDTLRHWLLEPGSLTQRLRRNYGSLRVQLRHQGWARPLRSEALCLGLPHDQWAVVREVYLYCNELPRIYARTVLPVPILRQQSWLTRLGTRPLGEVLFNDPTITRDPIEVARLTPDQAMFRIATYHSQEKATAIWGRRSIFYVKCLPLLVSEFFLPAPWQ